MRIHLKVYTGNKIIPYSHQHLLVGTIHKWLGQNNQHGKIGLFSFSRLENAESTRLGLKLKEYSPLFISAHDDGIIKKLVAGIQVEPTLFDGLEVKEIIVEEDPDFSNRTKFSVASPILVKRSEGNRNIHYVFQDEGVNQLLKETMLRKMNLVGIEDPTFDIKFDINYPHASTKLVDYKGIKNRVNWCPVVMEGRPETKLFAWNVGVGNSTGIGFGAIR